MSRFFEKLALWDYALTLTAKGRRLVWILIGLYGLMIAYMCFGPQHVVAGMETPNIQHVGRLVFLLVPFNSLVSLGEIESAWQLFWVIGQNVVNCFLLYPLMLGLLVLFKELRTPKRSLLVAFACSLFIECTQLLIDALFDANRVFEVDDLWTNSLGGLFALWTYRFLVKWHSRS